MTNKMEAGLIQIGDSRIPFTWASEKRDPRLPPSPNVKDEKVGLVLPDEANVFLCKTEPGWGGKSGITYFVEQNPQATQIIHGLYDNKMQTRRYSNESFLARLHNPHFNPQEPFIYPDNLNEIINIAQNEWGWEIEPQIFTLLAQASFGLAKNK